MTKFLLLIVVAFIGHQTENAPFIFPVKEVKSISYPSCHFSRNCGTTMVLECEIMDSVFCPINGFISSVNSDFGRIVIENEEFKIRITNIAPDSIKSGQHFTAGKYIGKVDSLGSIVVEAWHHENKLDPKKALVRQIK